MIALAITVCICTALCVVTWLGLRFARVAEAPPQIPQGDREGGLSQDVRKAIKRYEGGAVEAEAEAVRHEIGSRPLSAEDCWDGAKRLRAKAAKARETGRME